MKILVLGYGNRSRTDDGAGWFVVEEIEKLALSGVDLLTSHQLDIDMAETISAYDVVIFVDAAVPQPGVPVTSRTVVKPRWQAHAVAHYLTPSDLLALCSSLYGSEPDGFLFSIPAFDLHFGDKLSTQTEQAARTAVREIADLAALFHERGKSRKEHSHA